MPATAPCDSMKRASGANASACRCDQLPLSQNVMRPSGDTPLASTITSPAPPTARDPRCTKCQSLGRPSSLEYWHIGETKMRLRNATLRIVYELKSRDMGASCIIARHEETDSLHRTRSDSRCRVRRIRAGAHTQKRAAGATAAGADGT